MTEQRYMDIKSLTQYIPLKTSTIYSMVSRKQIPFNKVGSKLVFDRIEIDDWITQGQRLTNHEQIPTFKL